MKKRSRMTLGVRGIRRYMRSKSKLHEGTHWKGRRQRANAQRRMGRIVCGLPLPDPCNHDAWNAAWDEAAKR